MCKSACCWLIVLLASTRGAWAACGYVSPTDKDVVQPSQIAFITWNPDGKEESFTVQPRFAGNASDFGMVIPTPDRPKLDEMPRDFFRGLSVLTVLKPIDEKKYRVPKPAPSGGLFGVGSPTFSLEQGSDDGDVRVLEAGIVGTLDYKIIQADKSADLFQWMKDNNYNFAGDKKILDSYIRRKWVFTVMKIDPKQMKKTDDGKFLGELTPTRFTFKSDEAIYPLKVTQTSVKDKTEVLLYIQAPQKLDMQDRFSYEARFLRLWVHSSEWAKPGGLTNDEIAWTDNCRKYMDRAQDYIEKQSKIDRKPARLEWAKRIGDDDLALIAGDVKYDRPAVIDTEVATLRLLKGHLQKGQFLTKVRKTFKKYEMDDDLVFSRATVGKKEDNIEYTCLLPVGIR